MLSFHLLGIFALAATAAARGSPHPKRKTPWTRPNGPKGRHSARSAQTEMNYRKARSFVDLELAKRDQLIPNTTAAPTTSAPKANIWRSLSNDEAASVVAWLHNQTALNLTAAADAGE